MQFLSALRDLNSEQRHVVAASFLGWTLDAFDYFLLVFVIPELAREFGASFAEVFFSTTLTLMMRPFGALIFGWLADRFGRRPMLMLDVILFAVFEAASALALHETAERRVGHAGHRGNGVRRWKRNAADLHLVISSSSYLVIDEELLW